MKSHELFSWTQFPKLSTKRLILRQLNLSDAHAIFQMRANQRVNKFIGRNEMQEAKDAEDLIQRCMDMFSTRKGIAWAGEIKESGAIIGTCGFNTIEEQNKRAEIGGEMHPLYWGKAYSAEAFYEILNFGFKQLNFTAIEAKVSPDNRAAIALLDRIGFEKEGHFKRRFFFAGNYHDLAVYTCFSSQFTHHDSYKAND